MEEEDGESPSPAPARPPAAVCCFYTSANNNTNSPVEYMFILLQFWSALMSVDAIYELKHKYVLGAKVVYEMSSVV